MTDEFEDFLRSIGLTLELRRGPEDEPFGNWIIQYGSDDLAVSMVCDRTQRAVYVADKRTLQPGGLVPPLPVEYDMDLIREVISGETKPSMDYIDQKAFARANWNEIAGMFQPDRRQATHQRLRFLAHERMKRTFNPWPRAILEFEGFMQLKEMKCRTREAPEGMMGPKIMRYDGPRINVRIGNVDGWRVLVADAVDPAERWYDILTLRDALPGSHSSSIPFQEWFTFAVNHWDALCRMFEASQRETTHQRLAPLEEVTRRRRAAFQAEQEARIRTLLM